MLDAGAHASDYRPWVSGASAYEVARQGSRLTHDRRFQNERENHAAATQSERFGRWAGVSRDAAVASAFRGMKLALES
jgi:hypothetical protein